MGTEWHQLVVCLINFNVGVDFPNEDAGTNVANCAANDAQCATKQRHVSKVKRSLEQAVHSERKRQFNCVILRKFEKSTHFVLKKK